MPFLTADLVSAMPSVTKVLASAFNLSAVSAAISDAIFLAESVPFVSADLDAFFTIDATFFMFDSMLVPYYIIYIDPALRKLGTEDTRPFGARACSEA